MPKKILIVEDEESISSMYKMKFDISGYESLVADNGEKAVEMAFSEKPDLILLDIMLPKMNGYEVLAKLRADDRTKNTKIYMLSNLGQTTEVDKGFEGGADGFMIKASMTPSQLVKHIEEIFEGKEAGVKKPVSAPGPASDRPDVPDKKLARVLLVEDSEVLMAMYRLSLEKNGFEVEVAKNGQWAVKVASAKKFDVIIMDMVMPTMDGRQAIKLLKKNEDTSKIPIIVLSNSAQDQDIEEAKKMGVANYLLKSQITPSKLIIEIKDILKIS